MADQNTTTAVLESLQLNLFPEEWVKKCWEEEFSEFGGLPSTCEEHLRETQYLVEQLKSTQNVLSAWLKKNSQNDEEEGFWSMLVACEVSHKVIIALLAYLINNGSKISASFTERTSGIVAASVYIKLTVLPGSAAFKIYNPELFLQCCRLLNKWNSGGVSTGKSKRKRSLSPTQSSQPKKKRGQRKKRANTSDESLVGDDIEDNEMDEGEAEELTPAQTRQLETSMRTLLLDILLVCEKYSLRQSESTAIQLLSIMLNFARIHSEGVSEKMGQWSDTKCSAGILAYKAVHLLCQPFHGHVLAVVSETLKHLLDHILMMDEGKIFASLGKPVLVIRQHGLDFVRHMAVVLGERCVTGIKTLIQHLSFKVPDKSEYRSYAADAVVELLDCLPDLDYAKMLEWLKMLSKYKKVGQRSFVVDLMSLLLEKPMRPLSEEVPKEIADFATHKSMVCVLLSRCSDSNAGVRSRALSAFSSSTRSQHSDVVETIRCVITPTTSDLPARKPRRYMPTPCVALHKITDGGNETDASEQANPDGSTDAQGVNSAPNSSGPENANSVQNNCSIENMNPVPADQSEGCVERNKTAVNETDGSAITSNPHTPVFGTASFANIALTPGFNPYLPDSEGVVSMFHRRSVDTKVVVRKCALQALQSIVQFEAPHYKHEDLAVLQKRCADPALSVRKQAVQSLSELLGMFPLDKDIQRAWVFGTLPQVMDRETSVQERCFELLDEAILQKLKPYKPNSLSSTSEWDLLNVITDEPSEKLRRYLQKACQFWARTKRIKPAVVSAVQSHAGGPNDKASWMFLAELAKTTVKVDHTFVMDHWKTHAANLQGSCDDSCGKWTNILSVLSTTAKSIPVQDVEVILDDLKLRLRQFSYPTAIIAGMVNCVAKLHSCSSGETSQRQMQAWGEELMTACDKYMSDVILNSQNNSEIQIDEEEMIKYVFTLGEVCQRCPTRIPKRAALLIQSIVAAPCIGNSDESGSSQQFGGASHSFDQHTDPNTNNSINNQSDEAKESPDSQSIQSQWSQGQSQPLSQFRGSKMSSILRAHGFITLGKLCLVDENLSKKTIAALARELEECDSPAVRNNVVVIMGDLTIRYTTVVDRYITNIAACLKDPSALVRKNTLTILTRLLQEEYVKWKGVLFFRYIATLLDEVEEIKNLAEFCLEHLLLKKHPNMFFHPFVECIFHFNNYQSHSTYNKFKQTDREKEKFTLAGKAHEKQRMLMYTFMLEHMTDEQRFKVAAKLNKEILAAIVDKIMPLNEEGSSLLRDALLVLSCKEIKLASLRGRVGAGAEEDEGQAAELQAQAAVTAVAKKVFITQVVRRNVIENIVPVVIALKHMLEKARSPLLRDLMGYLQELMKDYKNEVKDILAADKQLAEEIHFDLRTFENQEAQAAENRETSRPTTPQLDNNRQGSRSSTPTPVAPQPNVPGSPGNNGQQSSRPTSPLVSVAQDPGAAGDGQEAREALAQINTANSPKAGNAQRRVSLTMKDAARKAMTRVEELRQSGNLFSPIKKKGSSLSRSRLSHNSSGKESNDTPQIASDKNSSMSSPLRDSINRAISTPADNNYNITFGPDVNVTMLPPSPIPSMAGGQLCSSPSMKVTSRGQRDMIHMPHPDAKDTKPKQWNIKSPTSKRAPSTAKDKEGTPTRKSHNASRVGLRTRRSKQ